MTVQERLFVLVTFVVAAASGLARSESPSAEPSAAATAATAPPASTAAPGPLSGHWRLNADKTEDAREKMREARQNRSGGRGWGGGGGRGGWGRGRGGMGGGWGRRPDGDDADPSAGGQRPSAGRFFDPPQELTISDVGDDVTILEKDGLIRLLHADGKKYKTDNGLSDVKTHRDKDKLVIETEPMRGPKLRETWSLDKTGKELTQDVRLEGRMGDVDVRRVYDSVAAP